MTFDEWKKLVVKIADKRHTAEDLRAAREYLTWSPEQFAQIAREAPDCFGFVGELIAPVPDLGLRALYRARLKSAPKPSE